MITLDNNGVAVQLSDRLDWVDEFDWSPIEQSTTYSTTGAMHLDVGVKQAGRPITLQGTDTAAWLPRSVCVTLLAWAALPGIEFTLTLRGIDRTVIFDHAKGGFTARPLWSVLDGEQDGDELLVPAFHFLEV